MPVESAYTYKTAEEPNEKTRLDDLHIALREFQNSQKDFAPEIYAIPPKRILDMGCGSGAWAFDAAKNFPDAEVVAADAAETLQESSLPGNMRFQQADVTKPLPFEPASFDIVHARLLFIHVPNAEDALRRTADLVKKGGWLFIEDIDFYKAIQTGGPTVSKVLSIWTKIAESRGADPSFGSKIEPVVRSMEFLSDVRVQKVMIPLCNASSASPELAKVGAGVRLTLARLATDWGETFTEQGITRELAREYTSEMESGSFDIFLENDFVWARRR
ncbi:S-adenosyl-L-methionine-dependent methyltransferase [Favolaschia claudopus]|uniref:S-adenosyl-L-methionine-dependent methyltransferase n=1 Tax=Favolaschia claudopus TaxID=2862362 RepID=A0AAW0D0T3_9AGAR